MKNNIFTLFLFCAFSTGVLAQASYNHDSYKHELTVGYGIGSTNQILDALSNVLATGFSGGLYSSESRYTGAFHLGYKYALSERLSVGPTVLYELSKAKAFSKQEQVGRFRNTHFTVAAEMKFKYLKKTSFSLYGLAGAGASFYSEEFYNCTESENSSATHFNFQLTPIGIQVGNRLGGFAEAGFGYKGIISAGVFARF